MIILFQLLFTLFHTTICMHIHTENEQVGHNGVKIYCYIYICSNSFLVTISIILSKNVLIDIVHVTSLLT